MRSSSFVFIAMLAAVSSQAVDITVDPRPGKSFAITWSGPATGANSGQFQGKVSLNGSAAELPFTARAERVGDQLSLRATMRYEDVPADWLSRFRPDTFDFTLHGEVSGSGAISWSGTMPWNRVSVTADDRTLSNFVKLTSLDLTALSPRTSQGRATLSVLNPFSFAVSLSEASCRLRIGGQDVGSGTISARTLNAQEKTSLDLPFTIDPVRFFAAVGSTWAVGSSVDSELATVLLLRLPTGQLKVPMKLARRLATQGARGAVSQDGANPPAPHR